MHVSFSSAPKTCSRAILPSTRRCRTRSCWPSSPARLLHSATSSGEMSCLRSRLGACKEVRHFLCQPPACSIPWLTPEARPRSSSHDWGFRRPRRAWHYPDAVAEERQTAQPSGLYCQCTRQWCWRFCAGAGTEGRHEPSGTNLAGVGHHHLGDLWLAGRRDSGCRRVLQRAHYARTIGVVSGPAQLPRSQRAMPQLAVSHTAGPQEARSVHGLWPCRSQLSCAHSGLL